MGKHPDHPSPNLWMGGLLAPTSPHEKQVDFSARTTGRSACRHSEMAEGSRTGDSVGDRLHADPRHSPRFPTASRLLPVPDLPSRLTQLPAVTIPQRWAGPPRLNPRGSQHSPSLGSGVPGVALSRSCRGFPGHQPRPSILSPVFGTRRASRAHWTRQRTTAALAPRAVPGRCSRSRRAGGDGMQSHAGRAWEVRLAPRQPPAAREPATGKPGAGNRCRHRGTILRDPPAEKMEPGQAVRPGAVASKGASAVRRAGPEPPESPE